MLPTLSSGTPSTQTAPMIGPTSTDTPPRTVMTTTAMLADAGNVETPMLDSECP
jgi:hypothetical protein